MGRILVAVLDWGLGHASRSTRIIHELNRLGHDVVIASSGSALRFLKIEFPFGRFYELPSYGVRYSHYPALTLTFLFLRLPNFLRVIRREKESTDALLEKENFSLIISDNRYGCFSKKVKSVFLGHQLTLPLKGWLKFFQPIISHLHTRQLKKFSQVWVPDDSEQTLSGTMGRLSGLSLVYIGSLSRFSSIPAIKTERFFLAAVVSGPEPEREKFASILEEVLLQFDEPCLLIKGLPEPPAEPIKKKNLLIYNYLATEGLGKAMMSARYIISRSGYSSLMDFAAMESRVLFVPTPGQPEQEYLARHIRDRFNSEFLEQTDLHPTVIRDLLPRINPLRIKSDPSVLSRVLQSITFAPN